MIHLKHEVSIVCNINNQNKIFHSCKEEVGSRMVGTFRVIYGQKKKAGACGAMPKAWTLESEGSELESSFTDAYRHFIIAFSSLFNLCNKNNNLKYFSCSGVFFPKTILSPWVFCCFMGKMGAFSPYPYPPPPVSPTTG